MDQNEDTMIIVSAKRYEELLKTEKELAALEAAGVDNWEWYGEAMRDMEKQENGG